MEELTRKKIENTRNIEFVRQFLSKTKLSSRIIRHPRMESILWKISTLMRRKETQAFSEEAINLLRSMVIIQTDGSIVILENENKDEQLSSCKYCFDEEKKKLRRVFCKTNASGIEITEVSTYDENGLEESLIVEQKLQDGSTYYSNTTRVPERIDMIRIERIKERGGKRERLEDVYQIRTFCVDYEDIDPKVDEVDPLDVIHMSLFGKPPFYRDLYPEEIKVIDECDGEIFPLDDIQKEEQLKDYISRNIFYGRTRRFERAVASFLEIEDRLQNDEK